MTVARFLDPPTTDFPEAETNEDFTLINAYFEMLAAIHLSPYFAKYLRSSDPRASDNKRMAEFVAQRIIALAPRWEQHLLDPPRDKIPASYSSSLCSALQLLTTILTTYVEKDIDTIIPKETRDTLSVFLRRWEKKFQTVMLGEVSSGVLIRFSLDDDQTEKDGMKSHVKKIRRVVGGVEQCGLPDCSKTDSLKACGRLVSVLTVAKRIQN